MATRRENTKGETLEIVEMKNGWHTRLRETESYKLGGNDCGTVEVGEHLTVAAKTLTELWNHYYFNYNVIRLNT